MFFPKIVSKVTHGEKQKYVFIFSGNQSTSKVPKTTAVGTPAQKSAATVQKTTPPAIKANEDMRRSPMARKRSMSGKLGERHGNEGSGEGSGAVPVLQATHVALRIVKTSVPDPGPLVRIQITIGPGFFLSPDTERDLIRCRFFKNDL